MTPSERNALLFLAALLLLGVSVRVVRSRADEPRATRAERSALDEQISAVDSVRSARPARSGSFQSGPGNSRSSGASGRSSGSGGRTSRAASPASPAPVPAPRPLDLDLATEAEIEALPWIGPVLAARIVADRDSLGPFGSLEGFQRVRGIGPGMSRRLADRVTFSQTPRHFTVEDRGNRVSSGTRRGPSARPRAP